MPKAYWEQMRKESSFLSGISEGKFNKYFPIQWGTYLLVFDVDDTYLSFVNVCVCVRIRNLWDFEICHL